MLHNKYTSAQSNEPNTEHETKLQKNNMYKLRASFQSRDESEQIQTHPFLIDCQHGLIYGPISPWTNTTSITPFREQQTLTAAKRRLNNVETNHQSSDTSLSNRSTTWPSERQKQRLFF